MTRRKNIKPRSLLDIYRSHREHSGIDPSYCAVSAFLSTPSVDDAPTGSPSCPGFAVHMHDIYAYHCVASGHSRHPIACGTVWQSPAWHGCFMHVLVLRQPAEDRGRRGGGGVGMNILAEGMRVASCDWLRHWSCGNAVEEAQLLA